MLRIKLPHLGIVASLLVYLGLSLPFVSQRPYGGDRIGQTAGIIRIYCRDSSQSILKGPHIHYGKKPFNLELTIFEWLQGRFAHFVDGGSCESVEPIAKTVSILFGALAVLAAALLAIELSGVAWAGALAGGLLAIDGLWLRYGTYTMIEHRAIAISALAVWVSLRRYRWAAFLLWTFSLLQKPQSFAFFASFWVAAEMVRYRSVRKWTVIKKDKAFLYTATAMAAAIMIGMIHMVWSSSINVASDLPWVQWMGPRARKWFIGNWGDRFTFIFVKSQFLDWFRRSGINIAALAFVVMLLAKSEKKSTAKKWLQELFLIAFPLLVATYSYVFVFQAVFVVHEYYALPLNFAFAAAAGALWAALLSKVKNRKKSFAIAAVAVIAASAIHFKKGIEHYVWFQKEIRDVTSPSYLHDWNVQVFPKPNSMVVMAATGSGRELFHLYLSKQRGFGWCHRNEVFAPRKFWKDEGVEYIAWARGVDPKTKRMRWLVRSMKEELEVARENNWSSDVNDAWSGKTMSEWAALGSRLGRDPCLDQKDFNPRLW